MWEVRVQVKCPCEGGLAMKNTLQNNWTTIFRSIKVMKIKEKMEPLAAWDLVLPQASNQTTSHNSEQAGRYPKTLQGVHRPVEKEGDICLMEPHLRDSLSIWMLIKKNREQMFSLESEVPAHPLRSCVILGGQWKDIL
ncbi:uncharacterized protein LOC132693218 [Panthera onca]